MSLPPTSPRRRRRQVPTLVAAVVLIAMVVAVLTHHHRPVAVPAPVTPATTSVQYPAAAPSSAPGTAGLTPAAPPSSTPARGLQGNTLALAWLHAYLERPTGIHDTTWVQYITDLSDPVLLQNLTDAAPNNPVGLTWTSWHVTHIAPAPWANQPAATPTRQITNWAITLTGPGHTTTQRLYTLTAYPTTDGWRIALAQQGYVGQG